jgi:hypothetical protein
MALALAAATGSVIFVATDVAFMIFVIMLDHFNQ